MLRVELQPWNGALARSEPEGSDNMVSIGKPDKPYQTLPDPMNIGAVREQSLIIDRSRIFDRDHSVDQLALIAIIHVAITIIHRSEGDLQAYSRVCLLRRSFNVDTHIRTCTSLSLS
jgi:hypothetical protein